VSKQPFAKALALIEGKLIMHTHTSEDSKFVTHSHKVKNLITSLWFPFA